MLRNKTLICRKKSLLFKKSLTYQTALVSLHGRTVIFDVDSEKRFSINPASQKRWIDEAMSHQSWFWEAIHWFFSAAQSSSPTCWPQNAPCEKRALSNYPKSLFNRHLFLSINIDSAHLEKFRRRFPYARCILRSISTLLEGFHGKKNFQHTLIYLTYTTKHQAIPRKYSYHTRDERSNYWPSWVDDTNTVTDILLSLSLSLSPPVSVQHDFHHTNDYQTS